MENFQNFNVNFDPNQVVNQTTSAILFLNVTDKSGSVYKFVDIINNVQEELFLKQFKNSHRKEDIFIKQVQFSSNVVHRSGFQPVSTIPSGYFNIDPDGMTALYQAVKEGLEDLIKYREDLESQGIEVRCNICIITDGEDNASSLNSDKEVAKLVNNIRNNEMWAKTFTFTFLGIGQESMFKQACTNMGLDHKVLITIDNNTMSKEDLAKHIKKEMGVVSQSVSSSSANNQVTF